MFSTSCAVIRPGGSGRGARLCALSNPARAGGSPPAARGGTFLLDFAVLKRIGADWKYGYGVEVDGPNFAPRTQLTESAETVTIICMTSVSAFGIIHLVVAQNFRNSLAIPDEREPDSRLSTERNHPAGRAS